MAQLQNPETYADGQQVTSARLNNMVNGATLTDGAINDQTAITSSVVPSVNAADSLLIYDASEITANKLRKATLTQVLTNNLPITTSAVTGGTATNLTITPAATYAVAIVGNETVSGTLAVTGATTLTGDATLSGNVTVAGNATFNTTGAIKLPVGTTGQRPASPVQGQIRYNTTTSNTEIYKGTTWEAVGGGPFDASGGNQIIAPDAAGTTPTSATFTSANGSIVVVTSAGHSVYPGQVVRIATSVTGYSGDWTTVSTTTNTFTFVMTTTAVPNSGSCTYLKAGNYKVHIFTSSGTFVAGSKTSGVEVLVVGGGGGAGSSATQAGGGGGGAVCYDPYYTINASDSISVTIGTGGAADANGTASVFGTITAGGGFKGELQATGNGGASGVGSFDCASNAGGTRVGGMGAAGGGGASQIGGPGDNSSGGSGGNGRGSNIRGIFEYYGNGGNGYAALQGQTAQGTNYGGGGSCTGFYTVGFGKAGQNGVVIVRYPTWV